MQTVISETTLSASRCVLVLSALVLAASASGCTSRKQRLAEIEARLSGYARACFAPGRRLGDIDACMRTHGFLEPGWSTNNDFNYTECEPTPATGRSLFCVGLSISFQWPVVPKKGMNTIRIDDSVALGWKVVVYDKFGGPARMM